MGKTDERIKKAFLEAMERGDYDTSEDLTIKRKTMLKCIEDYVEEVEREYFKWGFIEGQKSNVAIEE